MIAKKDLTPVDSSALMAYGYDPDDEILTVQFPNGKVYDYEDFPESKWVEFQAADSKGSWFGRNVRGNKSYTGSPRE